MFVSIFDHGTGVQTIVTADSGIVKIQRDMKFLFRVESLHSSCFCVNRVIQRIVPVVIVRCAAFALIALFHSVKIHERNGKKGIFLLKFHIFKCFCHKTFPHERSRSFAGVMPCGEEHFLFSCSRHDHRAGASAVGCGENRDLRPVADGIGKFLKICKLIGESLRHTESFSGMIESQHKAIGKICRIFIEKKTIFRAEPLPAFSAVAADAGTLCGKELFAFGEGESNGAGSQGLHLKIPVKPMSRSVPQIGFDPCFASLQTCYFHIAAGIIAADLYGCAFLNTFHYDFSSFLVGYFF